ncbi:MAG: choice-of-anchor D domain-containing protein [Calditrichia bacterium]
MQCSRLFSIILCVLIIGWMPSLFAQQVIKTVPAPNYPYGITYDGSHLWVGTSSTNSNKIWKLNPSDGSVAGTIDVPYQPASGSYTVKALAYDGDDLWVFMDLPSAEHPDKFYRMNPATGDVTKTINSPENNYIGGMTFHDNHIFYTQYYASNVIGRDVIIKMDTTGVTRDTIITQGEQPMGIDFNGQFFWCAEDTGFGATRQEIYEYDVSTGDFTGNFIDNPTLSPRDMVFDGQYYWLVSYNNTNSILYQFDISGGTPQIGVSNTDFNFGLTEIAQPKTFQISVSNIGTAPLAISALNFSHPDFSSDVSTFPQTIPVGDSYNFGVIYTPSTYGLRVGTMQIVNSDPVSPNVTVDLRGKGLFSNPTAGLTAASHDFGQVWLPNEGLASWNLGIYNRGIQPLELQATALADPAYWVDTPSLPTSIAPDDTLDITVWFRPSEALIYRDTLLLTSNDPAANISEVSLVGAGQAGPFGLGTPFWSYQIPDNPVTSFQEYRVEALKSIDDVTGDGLDDVIISSENYWTICLNGASSGSAAEVWRFSSYISNFSAGSIGSTNASPHQQKALAITNDLNGDGNEDVVIGTGGGNEHVYALDGTTGSIIWEFGTNAVDSFSLGDITSITADTDFNNDGINDIVATGSATVGGGLAGRRTVYCFDGPTGQQLWKYFIGGFLRASATIGDVNGNNTADLVIATGEGIQNSYVLLGLDSEGPGGLPTPIWTFVIGASAGGGKELIRYEVPGETSDIIAGAFFSNVYRIDGETGIQVWNFSNLSSGVNQLTLLEDLNADGLSEVLVSSFDNNFYCLSGSDGAVLWSRFFGNFSWSAETIPDLNQDDIDDVIVACRNDILYALNGANGEVLLQYPMNSGELQGATIAHILPDMDNSNSFEILGAADGGQIVALSGGQIPLTGISNSENLPEGFTLDQNYPNPFNPSTTLRFALAERSEITLQVSDILGRSVATIYNNRALEAGVHEYTFNANDLSSGIYLFSLTANGASKTRKMILMR